jgi:hypothetical protein
MLERPLFRPGWRASLMPMQAQAVVASANGVTIPSLERVDEAAIVRGTGTWDEFYMRRNFLTIDGTTFLSRPDFKIYPRSKDFLIVPLRPLPSDPGLPSVCTFMSVRRCSRSGRRSPSGCLARSTWPAARFAGLPARR